MYFIFYLIGSFLAFAAVLGQYSEEYRNPTMKEIKKEHPEATTVFIFAALMSWIYLLIYFLINMWDVIRQIKRNK